MQDDYHDHHHNNSKRHHLLDKMCHKQCLLHLRSIFWISTEVLLMSADTCMVTFSNQIQVLLLHQESLCDVLLLLMGKL